MKLIAVGDVHGRDFWKKVADKEKDFDKFVFIGDYFDNFPPHTIDSIVNNFLEIVKFKEANPDKVELLLGNHDFHYLPSVYRGKDSYSGYDGFVHGHVGDILSQMIKHGEIKVAYKYNDDTLFSHAGISKTWLNRVGLEETNKDIDVAINKKFLAEPELFRFYDGDTSGYGEHSSQGPLWIRPHSLLPDKLAKYIQVIGHTEPNTEKITNSPRQVDGSCLVCIDVPKSGEYLVIEDELMTNRKI